MKSIPQGRNNGKIIYPQGKIFFYKSNKISVTRWTPQQAYSAEVLHCVSRGLSPTWVRWIQSIPSHPTAWRSVLIWHSHLRLDFASGFFPLSDPHQHSVCISPLSANSTRSAHLVLPDMITLATAGEEKKLWIYYGVVVGVMPAHVVRIQGKEWRRDGGRKRGQNKCEREGEGRRQG